MSKSSENFKMVAKTFFGFEKILAEELRNLGAGNVEIGTRNVSFEGDKGFMYKANLCCRTAIKILKPIAEFRVMNEDDLYRRMQRINWRKYLDVKKTFAINATVSGATFTHSQYVAFKTKDAIADRFREKFDKRPDVDTNQPHIRINLHIGKEGEDTYQIDVKKNLLDVLSVIQNDQPDRMVIAGDLCCHEGDVGIYRWIKQQLDATNIPYDLLVGNHDDGAAMVEVFGLSSDFKNDCLYYILL